MYINVMFYSVLVNSEKYPDSCRKTPTAFVVVYMVLKTLVRSLGIRMSAIISSAFPTR